MHIPNGYLSLETSLPALGAMIPIWSVAISKLKKTLNSRQIPTLSLCAAFSFVVMMFNVPLGMSSVHAVGGVFIAILLGPWAACIAISVALAIQAFMFGDGGILTLGANCFNIAFIMPFAGYYIYRFISGNSDISSKRSVVGIFAGSYIGLNLAALFTAIELGIQPLLFKTQSGVPEFGFYPLKVAVPAVMSENLLVAGLVEALITVSAILYLVKFSPNLFIKTPVNNTLEPAKTSFSRYRAFILGLITMTLLAPLGLLATGTAWGEWDVGEVKGLAGFIPTGMEKLSKMWNGIFPDYEIQGMTNSFFHSSIGYIISAAIGILVILAVILVSSKLIVKKEVVEKSEK